VELLIGDEDGEHIRATFRDIAAPGRIVVQVNLVVGPFSCRGFLVGLPGFEPGTS
jgi:hypothetical protein